MVNYAKKMLSPIVPEFISASQEFHLLYSGPLETELYSSFVKLATEHHGYINFYKKITNTNPMVTINHPGQPSIKTSESDFTSLKQFFKSNRFPWFPKVSRYDFHHLMETGKLIAMGVVEEDKLGRIVQGEEFLELLKSVERNER